jgi:hypothetical protein
VVPGWEGRKIDLALVRRLCDTLRQGCGVAALPSESEADADRWQRLGFSITTAATRHVMCYSVSENPARQRLAIGAQRMRYTGHAISPVALGPSRRRSGCLADGTRT